MGTYINTPLVPAGEIAENPAIWETQMVRLGAKEFAKHHQRFFSDSFCNVSVVFCARNVLVTLQKKTINNNVLI